MVSSVYCIPNALYHVCDLYTRTLHDLFRIHLYNFHWNPLFSGMFLLDIFIENMIILCIIYIPYFITYLCAQRWVIERIIQQCTISLLGRDNVGWEGGGIKFPGFVINIEYNNEETNIHACINTRRYTRENYPLILCMRIRQFSHWIMYVFEIARVIEYTDRNV